MTIPLKRSLRWFCFSFAASAWLLLFLGAVLVLSACASTRGGAKQPEKPVSDAREASGTADAKQAEAEAKAKERLGMAAANVQTIRETNAKTAETPEKATIETEATLALGNIGVEPDPKELVAGAERERLQAEGKATEAQRSADESRRRAENLSAEEAKAREERDQARRERDNALAVAEKTIREVNAANARANEERDRKHKAEVAALQAKIEAAEVSVITYVISGIGGLCLLGAIAVVVLAVNSPAGLSSRVWKTAGSLVLSAGGCFAMIRFLAHPWVPYAVGVVIVLAIVWAAWQVVAHARAGKVAHVEEASKAETYKGLSVALIKNLGAFKTAHPVEWEKLSGVLWDELTTEEDALVAELKAEIKRAA